MTGYIYSYTNTINGKVYIGLTIDLVNRKSSHKYKAATTKENNKFYNAVRKYGWNSFEFKVLATINSNTLKDLTIFLDAAEVYYIWKFNSFNLGYNSTNGGHSYRGKVVSEEFREYCRNREFSADTRKKMSSSAKNRIISQSTKDKLKQNALRRNFAAYRVLTTEKRNVGIRKALVKPVLQIDKNENIVNKFPTIREAAQFVHTYIAPNRSFRSIENGISRHCKYLAKKTFYYGFKWKFKAIV